MNCIEIPLHRFCAEATTGAFILHTNKVDALNEIVYQLVGTIVREIEHSDKITLSIKVPATWWQHLKHSHAPCWFVKRYPVKWITIEKHFEFDLETIALVKYEYIKQISAHTPFIRLASKKTSETFVKNDFNSSDTGKNPPFTF